MEQNGWIRAEWAVTEAGRTAKYYALTAAGKRQLAAREKTGSRWRRALRQFCATREVTHGTLPSHLGAGRRKSVRSENERELREHMEMRIDANVAKGMSPEQAAREARLRFGNPALMRERVDEEDAALDIASFFRDARYAARGFAKSPGFTAVAIITLALGIGANTAVFQLLDAVRLRSLPIKAPQDLAELRINGGSHGFGVIDGAYAQFTVPMWLEVRRHHDPFSGVFAWRENGMLVGKLSDAKHVNGLEVSGEFFNVLGVAPWQAA